MLGLGFWGICEAIPGRKPKVATICVVGTLLCIFRDAVLNRSVRDVTSICCGKGQSVADLSGTRYPLNMMCKSDC